MYESKFFPLTLSLQQAIIIAFANSIDPDEMAQCLTFSLSTLHINVFPNDSLFLNKKKQMTNVVWNLAPKELRFALILKISDTKEATFCLQKLFSLAKWHIIFQVYLLTLTLSALKSKTDTFANSVDPDETAHHDLHCLPFCSWFTTPPPPPPFPSWHST